MTQELLVFKKLLRTRGYFCTRPRLKLFSLLQQHNALTIAQLIKYLNNQDQATVYRNIKLFEELGVINRLRLGPASLIELSDLFEHHHHHFSCINCGKITVLPDMPVIEKTIALLGQKQQFFPTDHQLEIRGYCNKCRAKFGH